MRALSEVSRAVSSSLDLRQVLDAVAGYAVNLSKSDGCGVFEFNPTRQAFDVVASHNLSSAFLGAIHKTTIDLGKTTIGQAAESGQPIQVPDMTVALRSSLPRLYPRGGVPVRADRTYDRRSHGTRNRLAAPIAGSV